MSRHADTIVAPATGPGGAIAVVRVSGPGAIAAIDKIFFARSGKPLSDAAGYTVHFGEIRETPDSAINTESPKNPAGSNTVVDEVLVTVFRSPHSYTGEDSVEISCHASPYVARRIIELLLAAGTGSSRVRAADPGEFTARAFLAGKLDLSQAEAVADLIASHDRAGHNLAMNQMKGGISSALAALRGELVELAALLELELDFGEEDVEFASRDRLRALADNIATEIDSLVNSFSLGNAIREGVPVAIVGRPNAGKSTLLNALVGDDRAMVSEIAGTTRDRIEERVNIGGVTFRFIDTAGLRSTDDPLELMGIDRALDAARKARIVLLVVDAAALSHAAVTSPPATSGLTPPAIVTSPLDIVDPVDIEAQIADLGLSNEQQLCVILNKTDCLTPPPAHFTSCRPETLVISAKLGLGIDRLRDWLASSVDTTSLDAGVAVISNARHLEALTLSREAVGDLLAGLSADLPADLLAEDIRRVLHHLGTITGSVTTDELLGTIFSRFCIGK